MSVYRYARPPNFAGADANSSPASVDVTLTNPLLKPDLDKTMLELGYEFVEASGDGHDERSPLAFPETGTPPPVRARAGAPPPALLRADANPEDRPTPVAPALADARAREARVSEPAAFWHAESVLGGAAREPGAPLGVAFEPKGESRASEARVVGRREVFIGRMAIGVLAFVVQGVALFGAFRLNDYFHLYASIANGFRFFSEGDFRTLPAVRIFYFTFEHVFHGAPLPYFAVLLALYVASSVVLVDVLFRMTARPLVSAALAAMWAAAPVHLDALTWVSSFGCVLSGFCALLVARRAVTAADADSATSFRALTAGAPLLLLGAAGAPSGVAVALSIPVAALVLLPSGPARRRALVVFVPVAFVAFVAFLVFRILETEPIGKFLSGIPLFVELCVYGAGAVTLGPIVALTSDGMKAGFVDDAASAIGISVPMFLGSTALVVWAMLRGEAHVKRRTLSLLVVLVFVLLIEAFDSSNLVHGTGGVAGIAVRSDMQYLVTLGWTLVLGSAFSVVKVPERAQRWAGPAVCAAVILLFVVPSGLVTLHLDDRARAALDKARHAAESALAKVIDGAAPAKDLYIHNADLRGPSSGGDPAQFPRLGAFYAILHRSNVEGGRRIRFVESNAEVLAAIQKSPSARIRDLFVGEKDLNGAPVAYTDIEPRSVVQAQVRAGVRAALRRNLANRRLPNPQRPPPPH